MIGRVACSLSLANPVDGVERALPNQGERNDHFAAMAYADVPVFLARLRQRATADATVVEHAN